MSPVLTPVPLLTPSISEIIAKSWRTPPFLAAEGQPLHTAVIDHFAIALSSARDLRRVWQEMTDRGARVAEAVHLWPDYSAGCPEVPDVQRKWMTTLDVGPFLIVLLAPHNGTDLITKFLNRVGLPSEIHHIALRVPNISAALNASVAVPGVTQITRLAYDPPYLSQVFLSLDGDHRFLEIIERSKESGLTFTCANVRTLTEGEAEYDKTRVC